jgi:hypothetical protein
VCVVLDGTFGVGVVVGRRAEDELSFTTRL